MADVDIVEVESTSQLNKFIDYPSTLYKNDPCYVTPLKSERLEFFDQKKNPFYRAARVKMFLAEREKNIVGRIAICVNYTHNDHHSEQVGFFGFFDCENDYEVASKLLKVAMIELKREGMEKMRGPMNFSTNHECGFLVDGFDTPPTIMMTYNHPYLPKLAEKFGLKKVMDLLAFRIDSDVNPLSERMLSVVTKMEKRSKITIRSIKMNDFENELIKARQVYSEAWEDNWGYVPMTDDEFNYMGKNLKQIVDPEMVFLAEYEGRPVGFALALPDVNQALIHLKGKLFPLGLLKLLWHTKIINKINGCRLVMFGVVPQFRKRGLDALLYVNCFRTGTKRGYNWAEQSWVLETNELMCRSIEQMGGHVYKRYRIVEMPI